ncbi:MAG: molecular chaperone GrpE (heat shock protein) [Planctomycetota bacterium]|jgi:molecular chaperone GrpE (heat shock protein)
MTTNVHEDPKGSSSIQRRSEDELIQGLEAKIREVEQRMMRREIKASPLHKDFERFKKHAAKFIQACADEERQDIANTLLGALTVTERQVNALD